MQDWINQKISGGRSPVSGKSAPSPKTIRKIILIVVFLVIAAVAALNSTYTINEQEQAVVTTFGVGESVTESGLHFKIPFIQQVTKVNTTIQSFSIGYGEDNTSVEDEALMITSDFNFVNVDFFVEYKVSDPVRFVFSSREPELILKNVAQSCIRTAISNYDVDSVLTTGKNEIQANIREMILAELSKQDIGLALVNISIQDSEPPTTEVMEAFKNVETAKQGKETAINNANKYRNERLPIAEADVDRILQEAQSTKTTRINDAKAEVSMFLAQFDEYMKNPAVTKQRMFYETMEEVLPNLKVIIDGTNSTDTMLIDDLTEGGTDKLSGAAGAEAGGTEQ